MTGFASNAVMGLQSKGITIEPVLNPRLSSLTTKCTFLAKDGRLKPFIRQNEVPVQLEEEDPGIRYKYIEVGATATRAAGYGLWQRALQGTFS